MFVDIAISIVRAENPYCDVTESFLYNNLPPFYLCIYNPKWTSIHGVIIIRIIMIMIIMIINNNK